MSEESGDPELHRVTVHLTEKSFAALCYIAAHTGDNMTDTINRWLLVSAHLIDLKPGQTMNLDIEDGADANPDRRFIVYRRNLKRGEHP
jgi:hypothetical protein